MSRIEDNFGLVGYVLKKFHRTFDEDCRSECYLGLVIADKTYNESSGVKFSTYATTVMIRRVITYISQNILVMEEYTDNIIPHSKNNADDIIELLNLKLFSKTLTFIQRKIVEEIIYNDLHRLEISNVLGISVELLRRELRSIGVKYVKFCKGE